MAEKKKFQPPKEIDPKHRSYLETIGVLIKSKREVKGISKTKMAENCEVSRNTLLLIEQGKVYCTIEKLLVISDYLDIPYSELFSHYQ